jgi:hypothetical protein
LTESFSSIVGVKTERKRKIEIKNKQKNMKLGKVIVGKQQKKNIRSPKNQQQ